MAARSLHAPFASPRRASSGPAASRTARARSTSSASGNEPSLIFAGRDVRQTRARAACSLPAGLPARRRSAARSPATRPQRFPHRRTDRSRETVRQWLAPHGVLQDRRSAPCSAARAAGAARRPCASSSRPRSGLGIGTDELRVLISPRRATASSLRFRGEPGPRRRPHRIRRARPRRAAAAARTHARRTRPRGTHGTREPQRHRTDADGRDLHQARPSANKTPNTTSSRAVRTRQPFRASPPRRACARPARRQGNDRHGSSTTRRRVRATRAPPARHRPPRAARGSPARRPVADAHRQRALARPGVGLDIAQVVHDEDCSGERTDRQRRQQRERRDGERLHVVRACDGARPDEEGRRTGRRGRGRG